MSEIYCGKQGEAFQVSQLFQLQSLSQFDSEVAARNVTVLCVVCCKVPGLQKVVACSWATEQGDFPGAVKFQCFFLLAQSPGSGS